jgi:outer membrane protein TolC
MMYLALTLLLVQQTPFGERAAWWSELGDEQLSDLIEEALAHNGDIAAASGRAGAAEVAALQALSPTLPRLSFDAGGNVAPLDSLGFQFGGLSAIRGGGPILGPGPVPLPAQFGQVARDRQPLVYWTGSAMLNAGVTLDLGRSFFSWRANRLDAGASHDDADGQALNVALTTARAYYDLMAAREQVRVLEQQAALNRDLLEIVDLRFEGGQVEGLDVLQQRQNLASIEALVPSSRMQERVLAQQLAVLLGRAPTDAPAIAGPLPEAPARPVPEDPEELARRRPEVRAAQARLDAAEARVSSSLLGFLPTFGLTAQAGQQAILIDEPRSQFLWGAGATFSLPLFQGAERYSVWQQATRSEAAQRATLRQARLRAAQLVAGAAVQYDELRAQLAASRQNIEASRLALASAQERYAAGLTTYQAVQVALNTTLQAELNVLSAKRQLLDALLALYDATAGPSSEGLGRRAELSP